MRGCGIRCNRFGNRSTSLILRPVIEIDSLFQQMRFFPPAFSFGQ